MRAISTIFTLALVMGAAAVNLPAAAAEVPLLPDSTAAERTGVSVTVYNSNLALVRESRTLSIDRAGALRLRFMDVPSSINPATVHLKSLSGPGAIAVLEQNYEYDLVSPSKLLEKYVGKEVEIVEQADDLTTRSVRATLLAVNESPVYQVGDRIVLYQTGKITLPEVPADLVARPTLVWTIDAPAAGKHEIEASYLTGGMNWNAGYVAVIDADDKKLDLNGWVTIANQSGAGFENATLKLVAGDVRRVAGPEMDRYEKAVMTAAPRAAAPSFEEEAFFEYHLYTLDRPTTIKDNQTKQISLFQAAGTPVTKKLLLTGQPWYYRSQHGTISQNEKVKVILEFKNAKESGLGIPLPKGTIRVYKKDRSGSEQFVGEDAIDHTPKDEMLKLFVGEAFDVVADRVQTEYRSLSPRQSESAYEISIRNRKEEDVVVTVREPVGGDWRIVASSVPGKKLDAGTVEFAVPVPKGQEVKLTYRVAVKW